MKGGGNLHDTLKESLSNLLSGRIRHRRMLAVLLVLSLVVSGNVFWVLRQTGVTMAGTAACGIEEHGHTDECFETVLSCGLSEEPHRHTDECYTVQYIERQEEQVLDCDLTEDAHIHTDSCYELSESEDGTQQKTLACTAKSQPHEHTDSCYTTNVTEAHEERMLVCGLSEEVHVHTEECSQKQLVCTVQEHTHGIECYPDENSDVETQLDWQQMLAGYTADGSVDTLVAIAESQVGYAESERNFEISADGSRRGYTRYGAWYGAPYSDWSAMFTSFCLHYSGFDSNEFPPNVGASSMARLWRDKGRFAAAGSFEPQAGNLIFFNDNTVGIITNIFENELEVVQGDYENAVCKRKLSPYDASISGYGITAEAQELIENEFFLEKCTCEGFGVALSEHEDACMYKLQMKQLAADRTAEELYSLWPQLASDAQEFILTCLSDDPESFGEKYDELMELIGKVKSLVTECNDVKFAAEGNLPENTVLHVEDAGYSADRALVGVNPNNRNFVSWYDVYNICFMVDGDEYHPDLPVSVTVKSSDISVNADEYFYVAHVDEATGEFLERSPTEVADNAFTFTAKDSGQYLFYRINMESEGGERILGTNWMHMQLDAPIFASTIDEEEVFLQLTQHDDDSFVIMPSDQQVNNVGGETVSEDEKVTVSKTIKGTDVENVFDITLNVKTQEEISRIYSDPDIAVVIVMDISNTMTDDFGGKTRYEAAMESAEKFMKDFAEKTDGVSRIGYVAFNTDAHEIFDLSSCSTSDEAESLINTMRSKTGSIIRQSNYGDSHDRFTNVEGGLKRGYDMLKSAPNKNKYIIFLSDGFPTTYLSSGYEGYDPYTGSGTPGTDGVFYDSILDVHCNYGTSYSDTAAIKAREMATAIKADGVKLFSIGVDVGGQKILDYIKNNARWDDSVNETGFNGWKSFSVVEVRKSGSYISVTNSVNYIVDGGFEIGDATSTESYKNWLTNSIGSGEGYYFDSTNSSGLQAAYDKIFSMMLSEIQDSAKADWVAEDPMPQINNVDSMEFIGFYNKGGELITDPLRLDGANTENGENTVDFITDSSKINWDLKASGFVSSTVGDRTTYSYTLKYRVRLINEKDDFVENQVYDTNGKTTLNYRVLITENDAPVLSDSRTVDFKIPSVHGFLGELEFIKRDTFDRPISGAVFKLSHDAAACGFCRGDNVQSVPIADMEATSDADGNVKFSNVPSGHVYTLSETVVPAGHVCGGNTYTVTVAYDDTTVIVYDSSGEQLEWGGSIINFPVQYELPGTGGSGTMPYYLTGAALIAMALIGGCIHRHKRKRKGGDSTSP